MFMRQTIQLNIHVYSFRTETRKITMKLNEIRFVFDLIFIFNLRMN